MPTPASSRARCGGALVSSVYVPNGRSLDSDHYQYKLAWLGKLRQHLDVLAEPGRAGRGLRRLQHRSRGSSTSGTLRRSSAPPTSATPSGRPADLEEWGWWTPSGLAIPRTSCSATGTTEPATFTSTGACGSTWCSCRGRLAEPVTWALVDRNARKGLPSDHAPALVDVEAAHSVQAAAARNSPGEGGAGRMTAVRGSRESGAHSSRVGCVRRGGDEGGGLHPNPASHPNYRCATASRAGGSKGWRSAPTSAGWGSPSEDTDSGTRRRPGPTGGEGRRARADQGRGRRGNDAPELPPRPSIDDKPVSGSGTASRAARTTGGW